MNHYDAPVMPWSAVMVPAADVPSAEHLRRIDEAYRQTVDKNGGTFTLVSPAAFGPGGVVLGGCTIAGALTFDADSEGLKPNGTGDAILTHTARSRTSKVALAGASTLGLWTARNGFPRSVSGASRILTAYIPQRLLPVGTVIASAALRFQVGQTHPVVPAARTKFGIFRSDGAALLSTGSGFAMDSESTLAAYNTLQPRSISYTADTNNTVLGSNFYGVVIYDESGANSLPGNTFFWLSLTVTGITRLSP